MRILVTIAHYFRAGGAPTGYDRTHASMGKDPRPRLRALTACITALHDLYAGGQCTINIAKRVTEPANPGTAGEVDVVVCTTRGQHLLGQLPVANSFYRHRATDAEPLLLGFECQAVLRDHLGRYDYYCYLEDDLILRDPWFFLKLAWFNRQAGDSNLLQPNRYEVGPHPFVRKAYIDGDMHPRATARFQDVSKGVPLRGKVLDVPVAFRRALNPHSGCYFLAARQMEHWAKQPYFLDRDTSFIGPLESAATLGVMKTFAVYKPALECAAFLEIEHYGTAFLGLIQRSGGAITAEPPAAVAPPGGPAQT
jgi:hypothetical protein